MYVFGGDARVGAAALREGQLAVLGDGDAVHLAAAGDARLLLLAGVPLREPVASYGPFVMNTREEIIEALKDYQAGRMGAIRRDPAGPPS
jgi:redox-sensitive bicupin YhaK (pirin superfamily)